jgi:hypothetical protein
MQFANERLDNVVIADIPEFHPPPMQRALPDQQDPADSFAIEAERG